MLIAEFWPIDHKLFKAMNTCFRLAQASRDLACPADNRIRVASDRTNKNAASPKGSGVLFDRDT